MDREQVLEDLKKWIKLFERHEEKIEPWQILAKIDELEEWYE